VPGWSLTFRADAGEIQRQLDLEVDQRLLSGASTRGESEARAT
jgi:hypothetical protein